jgi:hypothetical protein
MNASPKMIKPGGIPPEEVFADGSANVGTSNGGGAVNVGRRVGMIGVV